MTNLTPTPEYRSAQARAKALEQQNYYRRQYQEHTARGKAFRSSSVGLALFLLALLLMFTTNKCAGQDLPTAPRPKAFDRETIGELALVAGSLAADGYASQRIYEFPRAFAEPNPLARPFVRTRQGTALYFGSAFALDVTTTYFLRKHGHTRLAHFANFGLIALESVMAYRVNHGVTTSNEECGLHHPVRGCIASRPQ